MNLSAAVSTNSHQSSSVKGDPVSVRLSSLSFGIALAALVAASASAQSVGYSCTAQPNDVLASLAMTNGCGIVRDQLGREVSGCCFIAPEGPMFDGPEGRVAEAEPAAEEPGDDAVTSEGDQGDDGIDPVETPDPEQPNDPMPPEE